MIFKNSNEHRNKPRSQSARGHLRFARQLSTSAQNHEQKTQILEQVYGSKDASPKGKRTTPRNYIRNGVIMEQNCKTRYQMVPTAATACKGPEQLYQENINLKKDINKLTDQLSVLKGRVDAKRRRNSQRNKQLEIQFEKPLYWSGNNSYLITGIKHQYEKLKKQYEQQSQKLQKLKVKQYESKNPENQIIIQTLLNENRRLTAKIQTFSKANHSFENKSQKHANAYLLKQYKQDIEKMQRKLQQLESENKKIKESIHDKDTKIEFLEKLIVEKENRHYHMSAKVRKMQKSKENIHTQYDKLKIQHEELKVNSWSELERWKKKYEMREAELTQEIEQKDQRIHNLKEQIRTLEAPSFSKPIAESPLRKKDSIAEGSPSPPKRRMQRRFSLSEDPNLFKFPLVCSSNLSNLSTPNPMNKSAHQKSFYQESQIEQQDHIEPGSRVMKRGDKKNSMYSKKQRKVQFDEVEAIGQLIKFRMIALKISPQDLKELFSKNKDIQLSFLMEEESKCSKEEQVQKEEQKEWENTYITMKQTQELLMSAPFNLPEAESHLLARYLIEDVDDEYVYSDAKLENKRDVVKSIIKAIVGDYDLSDEKTLAEYQDFLSKYGSNVESALKTYYPNGKVNQKKFLEIITSVGAEMSNQVKNEFLARLAETSQNLDNLEYEKIFH